MHCTGRVSTVHVLICGPLTLVAEKQHGLGVTGGRVGGLAHGELGGDESEFVRSHGAAALAPE